MESKLSTSDTRKAKTNRNSEYNMTHNCQSSREFAGGQRNDFVRLSRSKSIPSHILHDTCCRDVDKPSSTKSKLNSNLAAGHVQTTPLAMVKQLIERLTRHLSTEKITSKKVISSVKADNNAAMRNQVQPNNFSSADESNSDTDSDPPDIKSKRDDKSTAPDAIVAPILAARSDGVTDLQRDSTCSADDANPIVCPATGENMATKSMKPSETSTSFSQDSHHESHRKYCPVTCFPPCHYNCCWSNASESNNCQSMHNLTYECSQSMLNHFYTHSCHSYNSPCDSYNASETGVTIADGKTNGPHIVVGKKGKCEINSSCFVATDGDNYNIGGFDLKFLQSDPSSRNAFDEDSVRLDFSTHGFLEPESFQIDVDNRGNIIINAVIFSNHCPSKMWIAVPHCENPEKIVIENPAQFYYTIEIPC